MLAFVILSKNLAENRGLNPKKCGGLRAQRVLEKCFAQRMPHQLLKLTYLDLNLSAPALHEEPHTLSLAIYVHLKVSLRHQFNTAMANFLPQQKKL